MPPVEGFDPVALRWHDALYLAGAIATVALSIAGVIFVVLGFLQIKCLKPYKGRYPYERFLDFDDFVAKTRPIERDSTFDPHWVGNKKGKDYEDVFLTWENFNQYIPELDPKNKKREKIRK